MTETPLFSLPDDETLYAALLARDPSYDGFAYVGVSTTGIFCKLTCPARKPKRENSTFFSKASDCLDAGYRPCQRCEPLQAPGTLPPLVETLLERMQENPLQRWKESDLADLGYDPSTVRRLFKRHFGMTFLDLVRLQRLGEAAREIENGKTVIDAQLDAGFDSDSGFRAAFGKALGHTPSQSADKIMLRADWVRSPIGPLMAVADQTSIRLLEFFDRPILSRQLVKLQKRAQTGIALGMYAPIEQIQAELDAYFAGTLHRFKTPLAPAGTEFESRAWAALAEIPAGETRSYAEQAQALEQPTATRAVARANGANPIAIALPCHRVIGADGSLTGYGGGLWRKTWLLTHEQRSFAHRPKKDDHD